MGSQKLPVGPGGLADDSDTRLVLVLSSHRIGGPAGQSSVVFVTKHGLHELLTWDKGRIYYHRTFVQSTNIENSKQISPEKELRCHSPYVHIYVTISDLYIPTIDLPILLQEICGPILGIYKSLTDTWMWKLGLRPGNSNKKGIHKWNFHCSARKNRDCPSV